MMRYHIGEFRQQIKIERETLTTDTLGGQTVALSTIYDGWALARPLSGSERSEHGKLQAQAGYMFVIRNVVEIRENDRITWDGQTYNIRSINTRGAQAMYVEMAAERGVAL